jgi:hypothetical protein
VEVVDAVFAFYGVAAAVVGRRVQSTLDISAEIDIFLLNFVAKRYGALDAFANSFGVGVVEKPFEDGEDFVVG